MLQLAARLPNQHHHHHQLYAISTVIKITSVKSLQVIKSRLT